MLRTLTVFLVISTGLFVGAATVSEFGWNDQFGDWLDQQAIPLSDSQLVADFGLMSVAATWLVLAMVLGVPAWRRRAFATMAEWPVPGRPILAYLLHTLAVVTVTLAVAIGFDTYGWDYGTGAALIVGTGILAGMVLYDFRGLLFPGFLSAEAPEASQNAGWVLPEAITVDLLGRAELRFELARDLRRRAIQMRRFSLVALAGIGALLVVAVNVILFAGFIANLGVGATGPERIQQLLDAENAAVRRLREQHAQARRELEQAEIAYFTAARPTRAIIRTLEDLNLTQADRERFQETATYLQAQAELDSVAAQIASHQEALAAIRDERIAYLRANIKSDFGASEETSNVNLLIASGITRFGILFIMLFIVQILVNLYRYSMRMSAYYLSQADALLLAEDGSDALLKVVPVLSPQNVDFGKAPQTPVQNLEKILEIAAKLR